MESLSEKKEKSKFLQVSCPRCSSTQIIFGKSAMVIKCNQCNKRLTDTTGGKTRIRAQVRKIWK